jgi:hypothetical protein
MRRMEEKFEHERALREFTDRGDFTTGLGLTGFHVPRPDDSGTP